MNLDWAVERALARLDPTHRPQFLIDPAGVLHAVGLEVQAVDHLDEQRPGQGACDGLSFLQDKVVLYRSTPGSRRQNFTLAHELGHWLIAQDDHIYDWVADQPETAILIETLCDRIAQRLLLPVDAVDAVTAGAPVAARHVIELYEISQASWPVCAIALAHRLPSLGAVVLIDAITRQVSHASVHPDPDQGWPLVHPWQGQTIPSDHPLAAIQPGRTLNQRSFWRDRWDRQEPYYLNALAHDRRRVVAVLSTLDLWNAERLHLDRNPRVDLRPTTEIFCCGQRRHIRGWPCPDCGQPYCPACKLCRCQRHAAQEQPCANCFLNVQPHLLVNGRCPECR